MIPFNFVLKQIELYRANGEVSKGNKKAKSFFFKKKKIRWTKLTLENST